MPPAPRPHLHLIDLPWRPPLSVAGVLQLEPWSAALISPDGTSGWSYLARRPDQTIRLAQTMPSEVLQHLTQAIGPPQCGDPAGPPFQGGWIGVAGFGLGIGAEPSLPQDRDSNWPDLAAGLYSSVLAFDHARKRTVAIGRGATPQDAELGARTACEMLTLEREPVASPVPLSDEPHSPVDRDDYKRAVASVVAAIGRGDLFQTNIARVWQGALAPGREPFELLHRLAAISPAPYAAWWRGEDEALVSNSPEQFLEVSADGRATTRPIKGTRPRGATPEADSALATALQNSAKDRAENLMIVDLMRNDLARMCRPGSVTVSQMCALESYANVHHLVSTIEGRLADNVSAIELFLSALPPGSVTGAPKVQAIRELGRHEPPRGAFCGSLFWAGFDGALESSVLIRTATFSRHGAGEWRYDVRAGAGITADSAPDDEADEVEAKAAMLLAALQGRAP